MRQLSNFCQFSTCKLKSHSCNLQLFFPLNLFKALNSIAKIKSQFHCKDQKLFTVAKLIVNFEQMVQPKFHSISKAASEAQLAVKNHLYLGHTVNKYIGKLGFFDVLYSIYFLAPKKKTKSFFAEEMNEAVVKFCQFSTSKYSSNQITKSQRSIWRS